MMKWRGFVLQYLHARDETCRITTWLLMFFFYHNSVHLHNYIGALCRDISKA